MEFVKQHQLGRSLMPEQLSKFFTGLYGKSIVGRTRINGLQKKVYFLPDLPTCRRLFNPKRWGVKRADDENA